MKGDKDKKIKQNNKDCSHEYNDWEYTPETMEPEVRHYIVPALSRDKWTRHCIHCGEKDITDQINHIVEQMRKRKSF